jgi:hypothetical protein
MFSLAFSVCFRAWKAVIWAFTQIARLVIFILNGTMFPQDKTGHPSLKAIMIWAAINVCIFVGCAYSLQLRMQCYAGLGFAGLHFLIIVTALLVISEENDVWSGYVRYDRIGSSFSSKEAKDFRSLKCGRIVKSLPLIAISAASYLAFLAVAVKGYHSLSNVLSVHYTTSIPLWQYVVTVIAQVPIVDSLAKWAGVKVLMEFQGIAGTTIKLLIHVTNISIIIGTFNSYFKQKSQIRRLVEGLASKKGDIPFLQLQAQRAPDEIKSSIIEMAIEHPEAHTRRRAMAVAPYLNILTFPHTMIHHLHNEPVEQNKRRALAVSIEIVRNNVSRFEPAFIRLLRRKVDVQLKDRRRYHSQRILDMLMDIRALLPADRSMTPAE